MVILFEIIRFYKYKGESYDMSKKGLPLEIFYNWPVSI
jgi:hypothetical protein